MLRRRIKLLTFIFLITGFVTSEAEEQSSGPLSVTFKGMLDARLISADDRLSWMDGGLGKARYGENGSRKEFARVPEASLLILPRFGLSVSGLIQIKADRDQSQDVDFIQAYLRYRPVPTSQYRVKARLGAFFPGISMENTSIGWTSPYSITPSAINTWAGEELKVLGAELTVEKSYEDDKIAFTGAVTGFNDKAGTLLFRRGWAVHDFKPGLKDKLQMAPPPGSAPGTPVSASAKTVPFKEIDERPGYYGKMTWKHLDDYEVQVMLYDNNTDASAVEDGQRAWRAKLIHLGARIFLPNGLKILSQYMTGKTYLDLPAVRVSLDYSAFYVLLSRDFGKHRISARAEWFEIEDTDVAPANINEEGRSAMLSYSVPTFKKQRLFLEALVIDSDRPARDVLVQGADATEVIYQGSYRFYF